MTPPVRLPFTYSVRRTVRGIELTAHREVINFVREMIPDGQMAGMMGHREVPGEQEFTFEMGVAEAKFLRGELDRAINSAGEAAS